MKYFLLGVAMGSALGWASAALKRKNKPEPIHIRPDRPIPKPQGDPQYPDGHTACATPNNPGRHYLIDGQWLCPQDIFLDTTVTASEGDPWSIKRRDL